MIITDYVLVPLPPPDVLDSLPIDGARADKLSLNKYAFNDRMSVILMPISLQNRRLSAGKVAFFSTKQWVAVFTTSAFSLYVALDM